MASGTKQIHTARPDVIQVQQSTLDNGHKAQQPALALEQRQASQILTVDAEHVECVEVRPLAPLGGQLKTGN